MINRSALIVLSLILADSASLLAAGDQKPVTALVIKYCADCHGADDPEGNLTLVGLSANMNVKANAASWEKVFTQLSLRQMPPEGDSQPTDAEREKLTHWIETELAHAGIKVENKLERPGYGNYVRHELLFGKSEAGPSFSPPRLWRIRPAVYESQIQSVAKESYVAPFNLKSGGHGFRDYDNQYTIAGADLNQLMANTARAAAALTEISIVDGTAKRGKRTPDPIFNLIHPENKLPTDNQLTAAIEWLYHRVLLREPTSDESNRLIAFAHKSITADGRLLGVRNLISAVLLSPESLYRSETGAGKKDEHGRVRLSPRELVYAISYALTDDHPDGELLKAAESNELADPKLMKAQVERLLAKETTETARVLGFFREYFEYGAAIEVFKDEKLNRSHSPDALVRDTDQLILHIYRQDKNVLKELLTTRKSFVQFDTLNGEPKKAAARGHGAHLAYNLPPDWKWIPDQPIELPADQRSGILTQPAWLVAKSGNFDNDAIQRGLWVRNKLLAGTVLDVPITVDAQLPDDETLTLRERMKVTEATYCWKCHQQTNPVGLPFEMFDHFGRWRTKELGKPIDTSGAINRSGVAELDKPVDDSIDLLQKLADSERVRQVFIRHAFRYWMGRNETINDTATLRRADHDYVASGGSMKQLIVSLMTSDSFLYRKEN